MAALLALAGCGDLPEPFRGNPGATALRLAQPPPARLAVETPANALLGDGASTAYAADLANSLQDRELPAVPAGAHAASNEWRLVTSATERGGSVVPTFAIIDPQGAVQGHTDGTPVPAAAWAGADGKALLASAVDAAPKISDLMDRINAARMQSDPHSLYNRPARVFVPSVTGAPGDGNMSLTNQMRRQLGKLGEVVQDTSTGADFTVAGQVRAVPIAGGNLRVEIAWKMSDAAGHDLGMVLQLNEVPPESVTGFWGDVALAVAQEAAGGVRDTIAKQSGHARHPEATAVGAEPDAPPVPPAPVQPAAATPGGATPDGAKPGAGAARAGSRPGGPVGAGTGAGTSPGAPASSLAGPPPPTP